METSFAIEELRKFRQRKDAEKNQWFDQLVSVALKEKRAEELRNHHCSIVCSGLQDICESMVLKRREMDASTSTGMQMEEKLKKIYDDLVSYGLEKIGEFDSAHPGMANDILNKFVRTFGVEGVKEVIEKKWKGIVGLGVISEKRRKETGKKIDMEEEPVKMAGLDDVWKILAERLKKSIFFFEGKPPNVPNCIEVSMGDFVPACLVMLILHPSQPQLLDNYLIKATCSEPWEKVARVKKSLGGDCVSRECGQLYSKLWWIILLRANAKSTGDYKLVKSTLMQTPLINALKKCLSDALATFPTLLCEDGCSMINRKMGLSGYPIEIQALFYFALRCAKELVNPEEDVKELLESIDKNITALSTYIRKYYWIDFAQLQNIYQYKREEGSNAAVNKFMAESSIPNWVYDFMPSRGGYLIGNVSPARMDFRWFLVGNCIAILSCLATPDQANAIMDLIEERWEELIGLMPLKITYPPLKGTEWSILTGSDPMNTRWSYHNGGSWPSLLWLLAAACTKIGRPEIARRALTVAEERLCKDDWPEYYDGMTGEHIGKQARKYHIWSISGYLLAKIIIENPTSVRLFSFEDDQKNPVNVPMVSLEEDRPITRCASI